MRLFKRWRNESPENADELPQAAARWLARRELGLLRGEEAAAFERWRANPEHEAESVEIQAALERLQSAATTPGIVKMREEALAQRPRGPLLLGNVPAGAAALILGGVLAIGLLWRDTHRNNSALQSELPAAKVAAVSSIPSPASTDVYETRVGETRVVKLIDGSTVVLNTASRVQVSFTTTHRNLQLLDGQALFEVAHDPQRPFVVAAGPLKVTALGTQFDVRLRPEGANVVLLEGHVRVEPLTLHGIARLVPVLSRHELDPGEQLAIDGRNEVSVSVADTEQSTSWRYGRLVFRGEALEEAVTEINRYSDHQIAIVDPALARLPVSGVFSVAHPENFVAAVSGFYDVRIEHRGSRLTELSSRAQ